MVGTGVECKIAWRKQGDGIGFYPSSGIVVILDGKCTINNCTTKCRFNKNEGETVMLDKDGKPAFVEPSLVEWGQIIAEVAKYREISCLCGSPIQPGDFDSYDHDGGLRVEGHKERQWVYHHCSNCGYDYSFQHILR